MWQETSHITNTGAIVLEMIFDILVEESDCRMWGYEYMRGNQAYWLTY